MWMANYLDGVQYLHAGLGSFTFLGASTALVVEEFVLYLQGPESLAFHLATLALGVGP